MNSADALPMAPSDLMTTARLLDLEDPGASEADFTAPGRPYLWILRYDMQLNQGAYCWGSKRMTGSLQLYLKAFVFNRQRSAIEARIASPTQVGTSLQSFANEIENRIAEVHQRSKFYQQASRSYQSFVAIRLRTSGWEVSNGMHTTVITSQSLLMFK